MGQGHCGGKIRKAWNVGHGDLCGVEVFDNLSELVPVADSFRCLAKLIQYCKV